MPRRTNAPPLSQGLTMPVADRDHDEMGRMRLRVRPSPRVYNGIFRAPHGATGAQRAALVDAYVEQYGVPSQQRLRIPLTNYADRTQVPAGQRFFAQLS
jgi:hypothetical protein